MFVSSCGDDDLDGATRVDRGEEDDDGDDKDTIDYNISSTVAGVLSSWDERKNNRKSCRWSTWRHARWTWQLRAAISLSTLPLEELRASSGHLPTSGVSSLQYFFNSERPHAVTDELVSWASASRPPCPATGSSSSATNNDPGLSLPMVKPSNLWSVMNNQQLLQPCVSPVSPVLRATSYPPPPLVISPLCSTIKLPKITSESLVMSALPGACAGMPAPKI